MIKLPELDKRNWKKILRELNLTSFPSLPEYLKPIREKLIRKEELLFSENAIGYAKLHKYFEDYAHEVNSLYVMSIDFDKFAARPPMEHQKAGVEFLLKNNRCILGDDMGLGKEQPLDSQLLTSKGWLMFGDLLVGDNVYGKDGLLHNVDAIYYHKNKDIYRITFSDNTSTECGLEHLWNVRTVNDKKRRGVDYWRTVKLEDIINDLQYKNKTYKYEIPRVSPIQYNPTEAPVHPYILGVLIADGSISESNFSFCPGNLEVNDLISNFIGNDLIIRVGAENNRSTKYTIPSLRTLYKNYIKSVNLDVIGDYKFIPDDYKFASVEQRILLLQGLMDSDGTTLKSRTRYTTVSRKLADDVVALVQSLGGLASISVFQGGKKWREDLDRELEYQESYHVNIQTEFCPFLRPYHIARWKCSNKLVKNIVSIEYSRKSDTACITVDSPDHLYVTNDYIVTHNTITTIYAALTMEDKHKVLVVTLKSLKYNFAKEIAFLDDRVSVIDKKWEDNKFVIVHYDALKKWQEQIKKGGFSIIILDEAHRCRNSKTQRSKLVMEAIKVLKPLKIWLLTGTPVDNRPSDYYQLLKMIKHPVAKNWINYVTRYCDGKQNFYGHWEIDGASNLLELHDLTKDVFLRRLKTNAGIELPVKTRRPVFFELKNKKGYEQSIEKYREKKYEELVEEVGYEGEVEDIGVQEMTKLLLYRQFCALEKIEDGTTVELIENILEENNTNKIIVFTNFRKVIDVVHSHFGNKICRFIDGRILDPKKRLEIVDEFNADDSLKILVLNLKVGSTGLNIQSANKVIINDLDWVPANMVQAEDRCIFKGQEILTKKGFIKVEDVKIGDYVYTHKGNFKPVIDKWTRLERKRLKAIISYYGNNKPLEVTDDHNIFVYDKLENTFKWLRADELKPNRHLLTLKKDKISNNRLEKIDLNNKINNKFINNFGFEQSNGRLKKLPENIILSNELMYALGVYVAEGSATIGKNSGSVVTISGNLKTESEWIEKNTDILSSNFNLKHSIELRPEMTGITGRIYSKELALLFIEWFGKSAHNKQIPDWIWLCNQEQVQNFLDGYYKGDGHFRNNSQQMTTVSSILTSQLILLHSAINQPISIRKEKNTGFINYGEHYSLEFSKVEGHRLLNTDDYILFRIHSLTLKVPEKGNGMDRIYDLTVDGDNSFVVGQVNVHNCYRIGQKRDVEVLYPIYDKTVEETLYYVVENKMKIISTLVEGKEQQYFEGIESQEKKLTSKEEKAKLIKDILSQMGM